MTLTRGWPSPQPSSSALAPFSRPMLTALDLEFALTTAWARLSRLESGCSGIVYRRSSTAKASTTGARFVRMTVRAISSSSMVTGSSSEPSSSWGVICVGPSKRSATELGLARLDADDSDVVVVGRFPPAARLSPRLTAALQAFCRVLAAFASLIAASTVSNGASAICLMLRDGGPCQQIRKHDVDEE